MDPLSPRSAVCRHLHDLWSDVIRPVPIGTSGDLCGSVAGGSERSSQRETTLQLPMSSFDVVRRQLQNVVSRAVRVVRYLGRDAWGVRRSELVVSGAPAVSAPQNRAIPQFRRSGASSATPELVVRNPSWPCDADDVRSGLFVPPRWQESPEMSPAWPAHSSVSLARFRRKMSPSGFQGSNLQPLLAAPTSPSPTERPLTRQEHPVSRRCSL